MRITPNWVSAVLSKTLKLLSSEPKFAPPIRIQVGSRGMRDKHQLRLVMTNQVGTLRSATGKHSKDIWDDYPASNPARVGVLRVEQILSLRETPCVPGSVAMREASQQSRGTYSIPRWVTPSSARSALCLLGARAPGPVVNEPDRGSFAYS